MKKLLTVFVLSFCALAYSAHAQTSQGNMMLGGGLGYTSEKEEEGGNDTKDNTFSFEPSFGYFVADNFVVGLNLGFSSRTIDDGGDEDTKITTFDIGPFVRYYKYTSNDKFAFYGEAGFGIGTEKRSQDPFDDVKGKSFEFHIAPGFSYFFNEHWAVELGFRGIEYATFDPNNDVDDNESNTFNFGVNSLAPNHLGIRYHF